MDDEPTGMTPPWEDVATEAEPTARPMTTEDIQDREPTQEEEIRDDPNRYYGGTTRNYTVYDEAIPVNGPYTWTTLNNYNGIDPELIIEFKYADDTLGRLKWTDNGYVELKCTCGEKVCDVCREYRSSNG